MLLTSPNYAASINADKPGIGKRDANTLSRFKIKTIKIVRKIPLYTLIRMLVNFSPPLNLRDAQMNKAKMITNPIHHFAGCPNIRPLVLIVPCAFGAMDDALICGCICAAESAFNPPNSPAKLLRVLYRFALGGAYPDDRPPGYALPNGIELLTSNLEPTFIFKLRYAALLLRSKTTPRQNVCYRTLATNKFISPYQE